MFLLQPQGGTQWCGNFSSFPACSVGKMNGKYVAHMFWFFAPNLKEIWREPCWPQPHTCFAISSKFMIQTEMSAYLSNLKTEWKTSPLPNISKSSSTVSLMMPAMLSSMAACCSFPVFMLGHGGLDKKATICYMFVLRNVSHAKEVWSRTRRGGGRAHSHV